MTCNATHEVHRLVAWRVARNAFFVLVASLLLGSLILRLYGISIPILRVAGGLIVAVAGWKLLSEGSQKELEATASSPGRSARPRFLPADAAFDDRPWDHRRRHQSWIVAGTFTSSTDEAVFVLASLCAILVIAAASSAAGAARLNAGRGLARNGLADYVPGRSDRWIAMQSVREQTEA